MWYMQRSVVNPMDDETAAAGYQSSLHATRDQARMAMENAIIEELAKWRDMRMSYGQEVRFLTALDENPDLNEVTEGSVRWSIIETMSHPQTWPFDRTS